MTWNPDRRPTWNQSAWKASKEAVRKRIEEHDAKVWPYILRFRAAGLKPPQIARALTAMEIPSPGTSTGIGTGWSRMAVLRIIKRQEGSNTT